MTVQTKHRDEFIATLTHLEAIVAKIAGGLGRGAYSVFLIITSCQKAYF